MFSRCQAARSCIAARLRRSFVRQPSSLKSRLRWCPRTACGREEPRLCAMWAAGYSAEEIQRRGRCWVSQCSGEYGACAHRLGGPFSLRPLSLRPCKAAAPEGPTFCFLNYFRIYIWEGRGRSKGAGSRMLKGKVSMFATMQSQANRDVREQLQHQRV